MPTPVLNRPEFKSLAYDQIEQRLDDYLARGRELMKQLGSNATPSWAELIEPEESLHDELQRMWSPVGHLNSVLNSDDLRSAYNACLPKLSQYHTELGQNLAMYEKTRELKESDSFSELSLAQQKTIDNRLRDFGLSGVALADDKKKRFMEISLQLSKQQNKFSENVLDLSLIHI